MGKLFVVLVLLLGAGLYFPDTRPVILEWASPVINPALTWQTRSEMEQVTRKLQLINREGQQLPEPGQEFSDFLVRTFQGGSSQDAWGNEYYLVVWPDSIGVVSRGPDLEINTADDVVETARIQRQRRRR